jgi:hypothetical protein
MNLLKSVTICFQKISMLFKNFFSFISINFKKIKEKSFLWKQNLKSKWETFDPYKKVDLQTFLNYGLTSLLITIMFSIFLAWYHNFQFRPFYQYVFLYIAIWILVIVYEHYFRWHKERWKDDPHEIVRAAEEAQRQIERENAEAKAKQAEIDRMKKEDEFFDSQQ